MTGHWLFIAYATVLVSELGGDRSLLSVGALATRFRPRGVFTGLVLAFAAKSAAAVVLGRSVSRLPPVLLTTVSIAALLWAAISIWREPASAVGFAGPPPTSEWQAIATAFSSVFFAEWADPGQVATATLASQSSAALTVWLAATVAMSTKGAVALGAGRVLKRHISDRTLRLTATTACVLMAAATAFGSRE